MNSGDVALRHAHEEWKQPTPPRPRRVDEIAATPLAPDEIGRGRNRWRSNSAWTHAPRAVALIRYVAAYFHAHRERRTRTEQRVEENIGIVSQVDTGKPDGRDAEGRDDELADLRAPGSRDRDEIRRPAYRIEWDAGHAGDVREVAAERVSFDRSWRKTATTESVRPCAVN